MHSSNFTADIAAGEKYIPIAIEHEPLSLRLNTAGLAGGPCSLQLGQGPSHVTHGRYFTDYNSRRRSRAT
jgi:hypothetical protein